jgi:hypothetical protein
MKVGYKMDYGKTVEILSFIWQEATQLENVEFLPPDFWKEYEDELTLALFVFAGWAKLTNEGKARIDVAWDTLCEIRELDPAVMYNSVVEFMEAQAVEAEVIPIEKGRR